MMKMSKLALAAALVAATVASPALAQSFNPRDGTGNVMPLQYQNDGGRTAWTAEPGNRQIDTQVAVRRSNQDNTRFAVRHDNSKQVAARHGHALERIAGHRTAHRGAA